MIEISHSQARRIIREGLDRTVPEEQWNALQGHLERCAECSAYRARRRELEKGLHRVLRGRWPAAEASLDARGLARRFAALRRGREKRLRALGYLGLALLAFALLSGYAAYRRISAPDPPFPVPTGEPSGLVYPLPTNTTSPAETGLQTVVALEAAAKEDPQNREIYLLSSGPNGSELTNLTASPAADTDPVWSPDGEWIAFLSDRERSPGQADIYVISVAGTRLTRLTADPNLAWHGPLAFSPEGAWIVASAAPVDAAAPTQKAPSAKAPAQKVPAQKVPAPDDRAASSFLYAVRLEGGTPPRPLPGTRGGHSPRFAPGTLLKPRTFFSRTLLAYAVEEGQLTYLRVLDLSTNRTYNINRAEAAEGGRAGLGALALTAFDWSQDGASLVYILNRAEPQRDPYAVEVRQAALNLGLLDATFSPDKQLSTSQVLLSVPSFSPVLSAALTPQGDLLYTRTYRKDGQWVACTPLVVEPGLAAPSRASSPANDLLREQPLALPMLCVNSDLERAAWSADGQMLITAAHSTTEEDPGIYAFLFPGGRLSAAQGLGGVPTRVVRAVRLADLPAGAKNLRPRPAGQFFTQINPQPALLPPGESAPPARPPADLLARALAVINQGPGFGITRLNADGSPAGVMENARGALCASIAPTSGAPVAFPALGLEGDPFRGDLYRINASGSQRQKLTKLTDFPDADRPDTELRLASQYGCPTWSPDGTLLAAWVNAASDDYLAVIPSGGSTPGQPARYVAIQPVIYSTPPIWLPDSRTLLVFIKDPRDGLPGLAAVDAITGTVTRRALGDGWDAVSSAALSPDGSLLAYTTANYSTGNTVYVDLQIASADGKPLQPPYQLLGYDNRYNWPGYSSLGWLNPAPGLPGSGDGRADQRLGMVRHGSLDGRLPSALLLYDPVTFRLDTLLEVNEAITAAAWSPDGAWALYSTPDGLWAQSIRGALEGYAAPVWLSDAQVYELDWK